MPESFIDTEKAAINRRRLDSLSELIEDHRSKVWQAANPAELLAEALPAMSSLNTAKELVDGASEMIGILALGATNADVPQSFIDAAIADQVAKLRGLLVDADPDGNLARSGEAEIRQTSPEEYATGTLVPGLHDASEEGGAEAVQDYWDDLTLEEKAAVITTSPEAIADLRQRGLIGLNEGELVLLKAMPINANGPQPPTGAGTDWVGDPLPTAEDVKTMTSEDLEAQWRTLAGDTWLCSVIQLGSVLPSAPNLNHAETAAIDGFGIGYDAGDSILTVVGYAQNGAKIGAQKIPPVAILATFADVLACRVKLGSGDAIDTTKVVNEDGEEVYASSDSDQKYIDRDGQPVHPDDLCRDLKKWKNDHSIENQDGEMILQPDSNYNWPEYPGYPYDADTAVHDYQVSAEDVLEQCSADQ